MQSMLGKKAMEAEILKEAVEFARLPLMARTTSEGGLFNALRGALTRVPDGCMTAQLDRLAHYADLSSASWGKI